MISITFLVFIMVAMRFPSVNGFSSKNRQHILWQQKHSTKTINNMYPPSQISNDVLEAVRNLNTDNQISPRRARMLAEQILQNLDELPEKSIIKVLDNCIKLKFVDISLRIFELIKESGYLCTSSQLSWLLTTLCDEGRVDEAVDSLQRFINIGMNPSIQNFGTILRCCDSLTKAIEILLWMESLGIQPNVITFTTAIKSLERLGDWQGALILLDHMRASGVQPNELTYCCIISACSRAREYVMAVNMLREMQSTGLIPNDIHYGSVLNACARCGLWSEVDNLIMEVQAQGTSVNESMLISVMNVIREATLSSSSSASSTTPAFSPSPLPFSNAGSRNGPTLLPWQRAVSVLEKHANKVENATESLFTIVMDVCEASGEIEQVWRVFESMASYGVSPGKSTFHYAMRACVHFQDPERALGVLRVAQAGGLDNLMIYNMSMNLCADTGRYDLAVRIMADMLSRYEVDPQRYRFCMPQLYISRRIWQDSLESLTRRFSSTYTEVVRGQLSPSMTMKPFVSDLTQVLRATIADGQGLLPSHLYAMAAKLLLDYDDFDNLRILLNSVDLVPPTSYARPSPSVSPAFSAGVDENNRVSAGVQGLRLYEFAIKSLCTTLPLRSSVMKILLLLADIFRATNNQNIGSNTRRGGGFESQNGPVAGVAYHQIYHQAAMLLTLAMTRILHYESKRSTLINGHIDSSSPPLVNHFKKTRRGSPRDYLVYYLFMQARRLIPKRYFPKRAFGLAAHACRRSLRSDWILRVYREAMDDGITGMNLNFENHVVFTLAKSVDHWDTALEIFDRLRSTNLTLDSYFYTSALAACHSGRDWERALCLLEDMKRDGYELNAHVYTAAISVCSVCGQYQLAISLMDQMIGDNIHPSRWTFHTILDACAKAGSWRDALIIFEKMRLTEEVNGVGKNLTIIESYNTLKGLDNLGTFEKGISDGFMDKYIDSVDTDESDAKQFKSDESEEEEQELLQDSSDEDFTDPFKGNFMGDSEFDKMKPDFVTYNVLVEALGNGGQEFLIDDIYADALRRGLFREPIFKPSGFILDLHHHSKHLAKAGIRYAFQKYSEFALQMRSSREEEGLQSSSHRHDISVIVGQGEKLQEVIEKQLFEEFRPSIRATTQANNFGRLILNSDDVEDYLKTHYF